MTPEESIKCEWVVRFYVGADWPMIKGDGIELECVGASREQAEAIAAKLNEDRRMEDQIYRKFGE